MIKRLLLAITAAGLLLAGFAPSSHAANDGYSTRIIGGSAIPITDAPWQVALIIDNSHLCGGSLIRDDWIVTAAHCMDGVVSAGQVRYAAGQANYVTATYSPVAQVIVHPLYSTQTQANDIALIRLPAPVTVSASIDTIALPVDESKASPLTWPVAMQPATVTGWGRTQNGGAASPTLQGASLFVLTSPSDSTCGSWGANYSKSTMLCGGVPNGSIDTCNGDSGGPLWVSVAGTPTLAGLTSFGLDSGCADAGYPGVYTRVTHYIDWILTNVGVTTTPGAPQNVSAIAGASSVTVSWAKPAVTGGLGIDGYTVSSSPASDGCSAVGSLTCSIQRLQPGVAYTFTVTATNAVGTGPASAPSTAVTPYAAPGQVTNVAVLAKTGKLDVSWDAPPANGDAGFSYSVEIKPAATQCVASGATSCTYSGLAENQPYEIRVTATNKGGSGAPSAWVTGVPVSAVKSKGDVVSFKKLKQYSGLKVKSGAKVKYAVAKASSSYCKINGSGAKMTKKASTCKVGVTVKNPNKQATAQFVFIRIK